MNQSFKLFLCRFFAILNGTWHLFFYSHFCFSAEAIFSIILTTTLVYVNTIPKRLFFTDTKSFPVWYEYLPDMWRSTLEIAEAQLCSFEVMLHETIRNDDLFLAQHSVATLLRTVLNGYNIVQTLQHCFVLKTVVANRPVWHGLPHSRF